MTDWQLHGTKLDLAPSSRSLAIAEDEQNKLTTEGDGWTPCYAIRRISQITDDVFRHFTEHVRPNGFKGMLVCRTSKR